MSDKDQEGNDDEFPDSVRDSNLIGTAIAIANVMDDDVHESHQVEVEVDVHVDDDDDDEEDEDEDEQQLRRTGRQRKLTDKARENAVSEGTKRFKKVRKEMTKVEQELLAAIGEEERTKVSMLSEELVTMLESLKLVREKIGNINDQDVVLRSQLDKAMRSATGSVEKSRDAAERFEVKARLESKRSSSKKSRSSQKPSHRTSISRSSKGSAYRLKMAEAEADMKSRKIQEETRRRQDEQEVQRLQLETQHKMKLLELEQEQRKMMEEQESKKSRVKFQTLQRYLSEQELGSDEPESSEEEEDESKGLKSREKGKVVRNATKVGTQHSQIADRISVPIFQSEQREENKNRWCQTQTQSVPGVMEERRSVLPRQPESKVKNEFLSMSNRDHELNHEARSFHPGQREHETRDFEFQTQHQRPAYENCPPPVLGQNFYQQLVEQNAPSADIPVFSGDPLEFSFFMQTFEDEIEAKILTNSGRLNRLLKFTTGMPHEQAKQFLKTPNGYVLAKKLLMKEYGSDQQISVAFNQQLRDWSSVKRNDNEALQKYYLFLSNAKYCLTSTEFQLELNTQDNLRKCAGKLPSYIQDQWNRKATLSSEMYGKRPTFEELLNFIYMEQKVSSNPMFSRNAMYDGKESRRENESPYPKKKIKSNLTDTIKPPSRKTPFPPCPRCELTGHNLDSCYKFREDDLTDRHQFIKDKRLCFSCLKPTSPGHLSRTCMNKLTCTICNRQHATCLHEDRKPGRWDKERSSKDKEEKKEEKPSDEKKKDGSSSVKNASTGVGSRNVALNCVLAEVKCRETGLVKKCYCFLDSMSNTSFIVSDFSKSLLLKSSSQFEEVDLSTMSGCEKKRFNYVEGLSVRNIESGNDVKLPKLYEIPELPVDSNDMMTGEEAKRWPHLRHLAEKLPNYDSSIPIGLLIGNDAPRLLEPHDVQRPPEGENYLDCPYAVKFLLGWSGAGPLRGAKRRLNCHAVTVTENGALVYQGEREGEPTGDLFEKMYREDFVEKVDPGNERSQEDLKFLTLLERETKFENGHYFLPLPFRGDGPPLVPDNREAALKDAYRFRARLKKDPLKLSRVSEFMNGLKLKGYAEKAPEEKSEDEGKRFFITYHSVDHPKKPEKTRVVFNLAKQFTEKKVSLNDLLMSGPDLNNNLIGVAMRWREEEYAFVADIQEMFYRNMVVPEHRSYLRYYWWDESETLEGEPNEMQMCVHVFGATSSPACASFALQRCADDHAQEFPREVSETLKLNFYVDDVCKSMAYLESGVSLARDVKEMCGRGGYNLTKFTASHEELLREIPEENRAPPKLEEDGSQVERVLGMKWIIKNDELGFELTFKPDRPTTKRGLLSSLCSVNYDPLGLTSPFFLEGRRVMQTISALKIDWNSPVEETIVERFRLWLVSLEKLSNVTVRRSFKPPGFQPVTKEIHAFADGSEYGYGSAVYVRLVDAEERVVVSLVAGKSRVIPLAGTTIPRAELEAARVTARLARLVERELTYEDVEIYCWTDSTIVLAYLKNETKKFKIYVANRVRDILELVDVKSWNHVATENNPADDASRGLNPSKISDLSNHRWFNGPKFLQQSKSTWCDGSEIRLPELTEDPELKREKTVKSATTKREESAVDWITMIEKQSDWYKMKYRIASVVALLEPEQLKSRKPVEVKVHHLQTAETTILRRIQAENYDAELRVLRSEEDDRRLPRNSALKTLDPFLDDDGILRVGGRLNDADVDPELRHPVILPKNSHVTEAIIRKCHETVGHSGRGITMNQVRTEGYHVNHLNSKVRNLIFRCVKCRRHRGEFGEQKMANLPSDRAEKCPPFSYCGVDMFGNYNVKIGRKYHKRYVALFTDLVFRGIHLESCEEMSADSFMNAYVRFTSRRGRCRSMRSDQGGNFVAASKELRERLLSKGCDFQWKFNKPSASHHGGVFERQIGTVRRILDSVLKGNSEQLSDEAFRTLLSTVESIVNSRPLTVENLDDVELIPISPMNLLTQKSHVILPPLGNFDDSDNSFSRKMWKRVQHCADRFWVRFQKEYLCDLHRRQKWVNPRRNFEIGDVVLVRDDSYCRNEWPLGRIVETFKGSDKLVRSVRVRLGRANLSDKSKFLERPITKIVLLVETS